VTAALAAVLQPAAQVVWLAAPQAASSAALSAGVAEVALAAVVVQLYRRSHNWAGVAAEAYMLWRRWRICLLQV